MRKLLILISWMMILILSVPVIPVGASSPPLAVNIEVETTIDGENPNHGPFIASGPAVDAGVICAAGETTDVFLKAAGFQSRRVTNYQVIKHFICDDGSGEFYLKLQVLFDRRGNNYNWVVVSGTGSYEKLHGVGKGAGPTTDYGVLDLFEGAVHID